MSNYDATNGVPFTHIDSISIEYPKSGPAQVTYSTSLALVDAQKNVQALAGSTQQVSMLVDPSDQTQFQIYDPSTGQPIAGQTVTALQVLLGIYAVIHANQLANDGSVQS